MNFHDVMSQEIAGALETAVSQNLQKEPEGKSVLSLHMSPSQALVECLEGSCPLLSKSLLPAMKVVCPLSRNPRNRSAAMNRCTCREEGSS